MAEFGDDYGALSKPANRVCCEFPNREGLLLDTEELACLRDRLLPVLAHELMGLALRVVHRLLPLF
jgi:hypothetical protein